TGWLRGVAAPEIKPEPLTVPQRPSRALSAETRDIIGHDRREAAERMLEKPAPERQAEPDEEEPALETEGARRDG
ncbi:potassium transporter TrkA, partial [Methylobacterium trifolii]